MGTAETAVTATTKSFRRAGKRKKAGYGTESRHTREGQEEPGRELKGFQESACVSDSKQGG